MMRHVGALLGVACTAVLCPCVVSRSTSWSAPASSIALSPTDRVRTLRGTDEAALPAKAVSSADAVLVGSTAATQGSLWGSPLTLIQRRLASKEAESLPIMPSTSHSAKAKSYPLIDGFFLMYWGTVVILLVVIGRYEIKLRNKREEREKIESLNPNLWSLNLIAAIGKAQHYHSDKKVSAYRVAALSLFMASLQISLVGLLLRAVNPRADPVTVRPASPWLQDQTGIQVNLMKWIMAIFVIIGQTGEVWQVKKIVFATLKVDENRLLVTRWLPLTAAVLQYSVSCLVIFVGMVIILSFQTAPDIIYSTMAVFFITSADEVFYDFCSSVFDFRADFDSLTQNDAGFEDEEGERHRAAGVAPGQPGFIPTLQGKSCIQRSERSMSLNSEREKTEGRKISNPAWLTIKFLQVFPALLGLFVMSRAFYTGVMPTSRTHLFG